MAEPRIFIVGIGISAWSRAQSLLPSFQPRNAFHRIALSAGTKALLDAGLSYDDVDLAIGSGELRGYSDVFYVFGQTGIPIQEADPISGLYAAFTAIRTGSAGCVLFIDVDKQGALAFVVASEAFVWRHPYLKDTAAVIQGFQMGTPKQGAPTAPTMMEKVLSNAHISTTNIQIAEASESAAIESLQLPESTRTWSSSRTLSGICDIVWLLRGWLPSTAPLQNSLKYASSPNGVAMAIILARADGNTAPDFKDNAHKNDGRQRLGYNPATETREIALEDWEAVRSRDEFLDRHAVESLRLPKRGGDRAALAKL